MALSFRRNYPGLEIEADWEDLNDPFNAALRELNYPDEWRVRQLLSKFPANIEDQVELAGKKVRVKFTLFGSSAKCFFAVSHNELENPRNAALEAWDRSLKQLLKRSLGPYVIAAQVSPIIVSEISQTIEGKIRSALRSSKDLAAEIFAAIEPFIVRKVEEIVRQVLETRQEEVVSR